MDKKDDVNSFTIAIQNAAKLIPGVIVEAFEEDRYMHSTETIFRTGSGQRYYLTYSPRLKPGDSGVKQY